MEKQVTGKATHITMVVAASSTSNICEVTMTVRDADDRAIPEVHNFMVWLSDAATGATLTTTSASGTVTVKANCGDDMGILTAKKCFIAQTLATGVFTLAITDTSKTAFYVCARVPDSHKTVVSDALVAADYGT